jgi:NADH:flavin oxidoreductase / NADH oxidase family
MTTSSASPLLKPLRIGRLNVAGRLYKSATSETRATDDGHVTDELLEFYEPMVRTGTPLIVTGNLFVSLQAKSAGRQAGIDTDDKKPGLRDWVQLAHNGGSLLIAQLNHGGRQMPRSSDPGKATVSASSVREPLYGTKPRPLRADEIPALVDTFAAAAARAQDVGFDGVQIHAAHGATSRTRTGRERTPRSSNVSRTWWSTTSITSPRPTTDTGPPPLQSAPWFRHRGRSTGSPRCDCPALPPRCGCRCTCARCSSTSKTSSNTCWVTRPDLAAGAGGRLVTTTRSVIARCCWCADAEACRAGPFVCSSTPGWGRRCMPREHATCGPTPSCRWRPWRTPPLAYPTEIRRTGAITAPSSSAPTHEPKWTTSSPRPKWQQPSATST